MSDSSPTALPVSKTELWIHLGLWVIGLPTLYFVFINLYLLGSLLLLFVSFMAADIDPEGAESFVFLAVLTLVASSSSVIATVGNVRLLASSRLRSDLTTARKIMLVVGVACMFLAFFLVLFEIGSPLTLVVTSLAVPDVLYILVLCFEKLVRLPPATKTKKNTTILPN